MNIYVMNAPFYFYNEKAGNMAVVKNLANLADTVVIVKREVTARTNAGSRTRN